VGNFSEGPYKVLATRDGTNGEDLSPFGPNWFSTQLENAYKRCFEKGLEYVRVELLVRGVEFDSETVNKIAMVEQSGAMKYEIHLSGVHICTFWFEDTSQHPAFDSFGSLEMKISIVPVISWITNADEEIARLKRK